MGFSQTTTKKPSTFTVGGQLILIQSSSCRRTFRSWEALQGHPVCVWLGGWLCVWVWVGGWVCWQILLQSCKQMLRLQVRWIITFRMKMSLISDTLFPNSKVWYSCAVLLQHTLRCTGTRNWFWWLSLVHVGKDGLKSTAGSQWRAKLVTIST